MTRCWRHGRKRLRRARSCYTYKDYPDIRKSASKLLPDLTFEIERVQNAEAVRGDRLGLVGLTRPFVIILLAIPSSAASIPRPLPSR